MTTRRRPPAPPLAERVLEVDPLMWHVPSGTAPGGYRVVIYMPRVERYSCDCRGNIYRGDCRHVRAVSDFIKGRATANQLQTQIQLQEQTQ